MARRGGFSGIGPTGLSGGLNPFGTGSLSGLSAYNIGSALAEMDLRDVEIRWGNGQATDAEYLTALKKALDATDPNTVDRLNAQNRLDDATYSIDRSKLGDNLDALIAFDQKYLATLNTDNSRYRSLKQTLDSELAQRRSRDYGKLVDSYNAGKSSTQSLIDYVKNVVDHMDPNAPDANNWTQTLDDLHRRKQTEQDTKVYQDYQYRRISDSKFLAYVKSRRDGFAPGSPDYEDWSNRLEDAQKQVHDKQQNAKDTAFFNAYDEGHKTDKQYLSYLRTRIAGLAKDDPERPTWVHRYHQAAFSLAEDELRFAVEQGKKPVGDLIAFYRHYRSTLRPGSSEYRTVTRALDSLVGRGGSGGRGGRGGGGGGSGNANNANPIRGIVGGKKVISPKYDLSTVMHLMTVDPTAPAKAQYAAKSFFELNQDSLYKAHERGDSVWLFHDPRHPHAVTAALNPDGSPVLDAQGKPVMVRGSAYLPVTDQALANTYTLEGKYHGALSEIALGKHRYSTAATELRYSNDAFDNARYTQAVAAAYGPQKDLEAAQHLLDTANKVGDLAVVINLSHSLLQEIADLQANPLLDDTRRSQLDTLAEKISSNPILPQIDPTTGEVVGGAADMSGAIQRADGSYAFVPPAPGWHHTLDKTNAAGAPDWGWEYDSNPPGVWDQTHVPVTTTYGGEPVTGEVKVQTAPTNQRVMLHTPQGDVLVQAGLTTTAFSFVDEHGSRVTAYSLDGGSTWIYSTGGQAPIVEYTRPVEKDDHGNLLDAQTGAVIAPVQPDGTVAFDPSAITDPSSVDFYGLGQYRQTQQNLANRVSMSGFTNAATAGQTAKNLQGDRFAALAPLSVGGPGLHMGVAVAGPDGIDVSAGAIEPPSLADSHDFDKLGPFVVPGKAGNVTPNFSRLPDQNQSLIGAVGNVTPDLSRLPVPPAELKPIVAPPPQLPPALRAEAPTPTLKPPKLKPIKPPKQPPLPDYLRNRLGEPPAPKKKRERVKSAADAGITQISRRA